jgi:hypothetical protein
MKQEIEITVPTDWSAITLKRYLSLKRDLENYSDEEAAQTALLFHHLCGVNAEVVQRLDVNTFTQISNTLTEFMGKTEYPLQKIIKVNGKKYGFEPNLSEIAYGAYVDLAKYETLTMNDKWAEVMSILYRPITKQVGDLYNIEEYKGNIDGETFLDITMDVHFGALSFFFHLLGDLQKGILKSLKEMEGVEIPANIIRILEESGKATHQLSSSPTEISQR